MEEIKAADTERQKFKCQDDSIRVALLNNSKYESPNTKNFTIYLSHLSNSVNFKFPTAIMLERIKFVVTEKFVCQKQQFSICKTSLTFSEKHHFNQGIEIDKKLSQTFCRNKQLSFETLG